MRGWRVGLAASLLLLALWACPVFAGAQSLSIPPVTGWRGSGGAQDAANGLCEGRHRYGSWSLTRQGTWVSFGERRRECELCGAVQYGRTVFPAVLFPGAALATGLLLVLLSRAGVGGGAPASRRLTGYTGGGDLCYSELFGNGVYRWDGAVVQDPLDPAAGGRSPLLQNVLTGEQFLARRVPGDPAAIRRYRQAVLDPPGREHIFWPSDLVRLSDAQGVHCSLSVMHAPGSAPPGGAVCAVLFPVTGYPPLQSAARRLSALGSVNWRNPAVRAMAIELVTAIHRLNRSGYLYLDFDLSRFFFTQDGRVLLGFSGLVYRLEDVGVRLRAGETALPLQEYPLEFALPAIVRGMQREPDCHAQNYSLCAMLFYLFFGRHAYDGRLMDSYSEDDAQHYAIKYRDYHKMPVFVFDPDDDQNALGAFDEEQQVIALWEQCPSALRELFLRSLCRDNAERRRPPQDPAPAQWLDCFQDLGWDHPAV